MSLSATTWRSVLATLLDIASGFVPGLMKTDVSALTNEVAQRITEELHYRIEATSQAAFTDALRGHPYIRIPRVIDELSVIQRKRSPDSPGRVNHPQLQRYPFFLNWRGFIAIWTVRSKFHTQSAGGIPS
jgi:hypothetical protein